MSNIETNVRKPVEKATTGKQEKAIERTIRTPASSFDQRPAVGTARYMGPAKKSAIKAGKSQSKKHVSSGRGQ